MADVCVAFKAHMGWVNAVAVRSRGAPPVCVDARRVELVTGDDREALEPYHIAGGWDGLERSRPPTDPAAVIRRGRSRQAQAARRGLQQYRKVLGAAGFELRRAVVLTGRGRLHDDLKRLLASHAQIHVAEGEAIRDATRQALAALGVDCVEQDEKDIIALAAHALGEKDPDELLRRARPPGIGAWRKEERLLALGAWLHGS